MRRFYYSTPKKQKLKQEALLNMRKARDNIDPDLLTHIRGVIETQAAKAATPAPKADEAGKIGIDRRKNLSIIMKFLELQPDRALRLQVRTLLNEELS
jgi:hypothetical protein